MKWVSSFNKDFKGIEIILFDITLFLLGKLNKTNEDQVIGVNIYWKRYPLHYSPPAKLHYVLIVWCEVEWLVGQQRLYGWHVSSTERIMLLAWHQESASWHSTSERNNTVDFGQKENFLFSPTHTSFFKYLITKRILIITYNKNIMS